MNRNDLIQRIDAKLIDNGTITFNVPFFVKSANDNIKNICFGKIQWENRYTNADLSDLSDDELSDLLYEVERQIESNNNFMQHCSDIWY